VKAVLNSPMASHRFGKATAGEIPAQNVVANFAGYSGIRVAASGGARWDFLRHSRANE
jgi:hypothetical protein